MAKFCKSCGQEIENGNYFCINCGARVDGDNSTSNNQNGFNSNTPTYSQNVSNNQSQVNQTNGWSITGFIISIAGIILCCCGPIIAVGLILSIIGVVKSNSMNNSGKGLGIAGIIISVIGLLLFLIVVLFGISIERYI